MSLIPKINAYSMPCIEDIPQNIASWAINKDRAVLLMHDMQNYFLTFLPDEDPKTTLLANAKKLRDYCTQVGIPIAYTAQPGSMSIQARGLLKDFWGAGMKANNLEKDIIADLETSSKDWRFTKWRYSAFHKSDLLQRMQNAGRDQLIICGVYAHIGVLVTAVEAFSNDIETFIISDAIADFSKEKHMMALDYTSKCCAVNLLTMQVLS